MKSPLEMLSRHVYPALKRALAEELAKRGHSVSEIARLLDVSKSLISRYLDGERGRSIDPWRYGDVADMLRRLADAVEKGAGSSVVEEQLIRIAMYMMGRRYICGYHASIEPGVNPARCSICPDVFAAYTAPAEPMSARIRRNSESNTK